MAKGIPGDRLLFGYRLLTRLYPRFCQLPHLTRYSDAGRPSVTSSGMVTMPMSEQHKAALAQGRRVSGAIKAYLEALRSRPPGRPVNAESVRKRIEAINERL